MRLRGRVERRSRRGPIALLVSALVIVGLAAGVLPSRRAAADPPAGSPAAAGSGAPAGPSAGPAAADDPLGNLVVTPGAGRPLPKLGVVPSLSSDLSDVLVSGVIRRDLDLCGEFELIAGADAPDGSDAASSSVDVEAWKKKGAEAVVRVTAKTEGDKVSIVAQAFLVKEGEKPVFDWKATTTGSAGLRDQTHRLADLLIGALTGQNGGFYSRMTFTSGQGPVRLAYVMDADGHDAHTVSTTSELAIGAALGKVDEVYWVSSKNEDPYEIRTAKGAVSLPVKGSVYGLAFSKDRSQVAVSVGTSDAIRVFTGSDFSSLTQASKIKTAIEPTFTPDGKLAYSGAGAYGQRIYVGEKAITPPGIFASSPTFCNHPDGVIAIFAAGAGKNTDLVRTGEQGGQLVRLTAGQGINSAPACSPDGRLVAFFSTRKTGEGPGLYIMRVDGRRPKRVSTFVGTSLRWEPRPTPPAAATTTAATTATTTAPSATTSAAPSATAAPSTTAAPTTTATGR